MKYKTMRTTAIILMILVLAGVGFYLFPKNSVENAEVVVSSKLFYYNKFEDPQIFCSRDAVLPVERQMPITKSPIWNTISLLLRGEISDMEKNQGFTTEFPNKDFKLLAAVLNDGILVLKFTEVSGFTTGGSCRVGLLRAQIEKTAMQFAGVKEVRFEPESLFQP